LVEGGLRFDTLRRGSAGVSLLEIYRFLERIIVAASNTRNNFVEGASHRDGKKSTPFADTIFDGIRANLTGWESV